MANDDQKQIIQEMMAANERIVHAVVTNEGSFQGQAPVNERIIKQAPVNERVVDAQPSTDTGSSDSSTSQNGTD